MPIPHNCLLLEHNAHLAFRLCKWTLIATEVRSRSPHFRMGVRLKGWLWQFRPLLNCLAGPEQIQDSHLCISGAVPRDSAHRRLRNVLPSAQQP